MVSFNFSFKLPSLVLLVSFRGLLMGLPLVSTQCPDDCCYWYSEIPGNLTCNPQGQPRTVTLRIAIYTPNTTIASVRVKWYRSELEELASNSGELLHIEDFDPNNKRTTFASGDFRGFSRLSSSINVENFTASDNGYYWCQIQVNDTCLQPSPSGLITFNSTSRTNCSQVNNIHGINLFLIGQSPICAEGSFSCSSIISTPSTILNTTSSRMSGCFQKAGSGSGDKAFENEACTYGVIAGSSVLLVSCLLLVVVVSLCICVRKRKKKRAMEVGTAKPASSDYKIQSTHTDTCMTDESYSAETNDSILHPASNVQGFASQVPGSDPFEDPSAIPLRSMTTVEQPPQESHMYDVIEDNNPALASGKNKKRGERKDEVVQKSLSIHASTVNKCYASLNPDSVMYESMYSQSSGGPSINGERIRGEEIRGSEVESTGRRADHYSRIDKWTLDAPGDYEHVGEKNS